MRQPEDVVLAHLLGHLRQVPADRLRACLQSARSDRGFGALAVEQGLLPPDELPGYQAAARFLLAADALRACSAPGCRTQVAAPPAPGAPCPRCGKPLFRGVLSAAQALVLDAQLERHARRLIQEGLTRARTQGRVAEANRLRGEGKIGVRPESELAPRERACNEQVLGHYALQALLGRGGSSWVYRAEDRRDGRSVALKVLYFDQGESPAAVQEKLARFQREAELATQLDHPNLVAVGPLEVAGGWHHLPMTLVDGPTLEQLLEARAAAAAAGGPPAAGTDLRALASAIVEIARGLHYAHCHGIVHRDVNPRNILFSSAGHPALSDFGVARLLDGQSQLTSDQAVLGTLEYAAPERLRSEKLADARSDVYSLGVVLFRVLTGRVPYPASNPLLLLNQIEKAAPPSAVELNREVTPALEAVVRKALEKDPGMRFSSALEFAEALAGALEPEGGGEDPAAPAQARPASTPATDPRARRRALRLAGALAVLAFAAGVVVTDALSVPGLPEGDELRTALAATFRRLESARTGEVERLRREAARLLEHAEITHALPPADLAYWHGRSAWSHGDLMDAESWFGRACAGAHAARARLDHALSAMLLAERQGASARGRELRQAALADFEAVQAERGTTWEGRVSRAGIALLRDDPDTAYSDAHGLNREDLGRSEAAFLEGWTALRAGAAAIAATAFEHLTTRFPAHPFARAALALALLKHGNAVRAVEQARAVHVLWPDLVDAYAVEGLALLRLERGEEGLEALDEAVRRDHRSPEFQRLRAQALQDAGRICEAAAALSSVLRLDPTAGDALFLRGKVRLEHGDRETGHADLEDYLERFPDGEDAEEARGLVGR